MDATSKGILLLCALAAPAAAAPTWKAGTPVEPRIPARSAAAMAYDPAREEVVLFGGRECGYYGLFGDTWLYRGVGWREAQVPGPPARADHRMELDTSRGEVVLFGGTTGQPMNDLWKWNGSAWSLVPPSASVPAARFAHAMAFDSARGRLVVFGGRTITTFLGDTWEHDGTQWLMGPPAPPGLTQRAYLDATYHATLGSIVMCGGTTGSAYFDETWLFDGAAWSAGPQGPQVALHSMSYDASRARTVVHGYGATYEFDGASWLQGPPGGNAYEGSSLAFDAGRRVVVLFGRSPYTTNETWEYDGTAWVGPAEPRDHPRTPQAPMVYDASRQRVVRFGGGGGIESSETWEHDGIRWTRAAGAPSGLVPRRGHAVAYDSVRRKTVAHGGYGGIGVGYFDDTWEYDGTAWVAGPASPAPLGERASHAMAFDPGRRVVVAFGGWDGTANNDDTWEYDGSSWSPGPAPPTALRARAGHVMVHHAASSRILLFGGGDGGWRFRDTWLFDGSAWTQGPPPPPGLVKPALSTIAYDPRRQRSVLLVTSDAAPYATYTWEWDGAAWSIAASPPPSFPQGIGLVHSDLNGTIDILSYVDIYAIDCLQPAWTYGCLTLSPPTLPPGDVGTPYAATITATGGPAPHTFDVTAGALPPGLAVSTSGVLSGVPTQRGGFTFLVRALDADGCGGSQVYHLAIGPADNFLVGQGLGPTNGNRVLVYTAAGAATPVDFLPYGAAAWGANVAAGQLDSTAHEEILTGPGPGPANGPTVRGFRRDGTPIAKVNFHAYATLRYGVNPAAGELDGDAFHEILTGPGPGDVFGPHVRGWNVDGGAVASIAKISFYAYATLRYGANVATGSVDADAYFEILTGPGPGPSFAPYVRAFDYDAASVTAIAKVAFWAYAPLQYGVVIGAGDADGDGSAEVLTAPGAGPGTGFPSRFLGWNYDGAAIATLPGFDRTPFGTTYGGRLGAGDVDPDGRDDLVCGAGRDPAADATVFAYRYDGFALRRLDPILEPFVPASCGVNVGVVAAGY